MVVAVIGQGTMGAGIAQVAAQNNCKVVAFDMQDAVLQKAKTNLDNTLNKLVEKQKITFAEKQKIQDNIIYTTAIKDLHESNLVIEAIVENLDIKKKLFAQLETIVSTECILATNTSSLSVTSIAAACTKTERVIGIHFFNPAPLMALVEIIPALQTSNEVITTAKTTIEAWAKIAVIAKDTPGFIVNRIARPYYSEALRIYDEGIAPMNVIDAAMCSVGFKMGPFALMDMIGHDVNYVVTETVWQSMFYDARYKPSHTQKRLLEAGWLGKKSGKGFYNYTEQNTTEAIEIDDAQVKSIADRILLMLFNEAGDAAYMNVANSADIETAMTKGVNYPKGLLAWANEYGHAEVCKGLDALYAFYGEDRYRCSPYFRK